MKTLWLFSRRGAAKPAAGPEFLPWSCWRAQTPWHEESLSSLSHNQMEAWQTHQNRLSRTSDSTYWEPHAGYQYGWFSQCSTAHLNGLIYKDLMLRESKWVWVVAFRQGDHTDDVRLLRSIVSIKGNQNHTDTKFWRRNLLFWKYEWNSWMETASRNIFTTVHYFRSPAYIWGQSLLCPFQWWTRKCLSRIIVF